MCCPCADLRALNAAVVTTSRRRTAVLRELEAVVRAFAFRTPHLSRTRPTQSLPHSLGANILVTRNIFANPVNQPILGADISYAIHVSPRDVTQSTTLTAQFSIERMILKA